MWVRWWVGALVVAADPAWAECTGGACYDGLAQLVQAVVAYGLIGIVLLVLLIVPRWRKTGVRGLLAVLALGIGVPLLTQAWQRVQLWWVETGEVLGQPPAMASRTPLLVAPDDRCWDDLCAAVLLGRGAQGVYGLRLVALEGRDMAQPLVLADLPLEIWTMGAGGEPLRRGLTPAERVAALAHIDYLILMDRAFYPDAPGPLEAALDLDARVRLRLAMAPVQAGAKTLDLRRLSFDVLDLTSRHEALGIPLAPGNSGTLWSDPLDPERVGRSLCSQGNAEPDWVCMDAARH